MTRFYRAMAAMMLPCVLSACGAHIAISRAALACSSLVPSQLSDETPGADLPDTSLQISRDPLEAVKRWQAFGDAQTGQLDKANLTKAASLEIVRKCEARDAALDEALTTRKRVLGIF